MGFVWALSCGSFELAFGVSFQNNFHLCFFGGEFFFWSDQDGVSIFRLGIRQT